MDKEKVKPMSKNDFIKSVALDCIANMKEEDKEYIRDNPCSSDYHFGYALYIRNHYIHNQDFSGVGFWGHPDDLSGCIMTYIISELLPGEYTYGDEFTDQLFQHEEFIRLRREYKKIYGHYPVDIIQKYASIEATRRIHERRGKIIAKLIEELRTQIRGGRG